MNLDMIKHGMTQTFGKTELYLKKNSPQILLGAGLVGVVATVIMASKATLKAESIISEHHQNMAAIDLAGSLPGDYSEQDAMKDKATLYVQTGIKFAKLYGPTVGVGVLSIAAILGAHGVMAKRQVALTAAYGLLAEGYKNYRQRVVEVLGEEKDMEFHLGLREEEEIPTLNEDGTVSIKKKKKGKESKLVATGPMPSMYARCFDSSNILYKPSRELNAVYIQAQQNYLNDLLLLKGYVFLNQAYERLGFPETPEGQLVGWVLRDPETMEKEKRDGYISFGLNKYPANREFLEGTNDAVWLDFNVDGIVYHLLEG